MSSSRTVAQTLAACMLALTVACAVAQQAYPVKPIRFIVPFPPGGSTDPMARLAGQKLAESWSQQVIIDNRPGGNTIIGTEAAAKSPPDGYTILLTLNTHVLLPLLLPTPYDGIKDFAAIATIASSEQILAAHPSLPANNLKELIALAKSRPGQLNYASSGSGTINHLASEFFNLVAGVQIQHIPYKGGGPALTDLMAGQVQLHFNVPINLVPSAKSGKIKAIAVSGDKRLASLPQVPTFAEAGLPGFEARASYWIFAPAGTPRQIIDKLSTEFAKITAMPDILEKLAGIGLEPFISNADQLAALMKTESAKFAKIVKSANIKLEN